MKFPISLLDKEGYDKRLSELLIDEDCLIYIDTNIFALLYKMHGSARAEFFSWADPLIKAGRIRTPVWVLNEYTKQFIRNRTADYFSPLKKMAVVKNDFSEVGNFLKMNIDISGLKGSGFGSVEDFVAELDLIADKLEKVRKIAGTKDMDYILEVHEQIQSRFCDTVLDSNIYEHISALEVVGPGRYLAELPPGFKDAAKDNNRYGDLIIWNEILEHVERNNIKKILILTNDNKTDWMYAPQKIKMGKITKPNSQPEFRIADTRLVYEFSLRAKSEDLYIVNFETLTHRLIAGSNSSFLQLARALQLVHEAKSEVLSETEPIEIDIVFDDAPKRGLETTEGKEESATIPSRSSMFSPRALADGLYTSDQGTELGQIIEKLRSHDWYQQNDAIQELRHIDRFDPGQNQDRKDALFVLGRNIYQTACGGAFGAGDYLEDIRRHFKGFPKGMKICMAAGLFFEIYFDSWGDFRKNELKTGFLDIVFSLQEMPELTEAVSFIRSELEGYVDYLTVRPNVVPEIAVLDVNLSLLEEEMIGEVENITDIALKGKSMLHHAVSRADFGGYFTNELELKKEIGAHLGIPVAQLRLNYNPPHVKGYFFYLRGKTIAKKLS